jgi:hypothetical protein
VPSQVRRSARSTPLGCGFALQAASPTIGRSTRRAWPRAELAERSGLDRTRASTPHCTRPSGGNGKCTETVNGLLDHTSHRTPDHTLTPLKPHTAASNRGWNRRKGDCGCGPPGGGVQVVDGALGMSTGGDQCTAIGGEDREPGGEVGGVIGSGGLIHTELGAPERRTKLGYEFFGPYARSPNRPDRSRPTRSAWPVQWVCSCAEVE